MVVGRVLAPPAWPRIVAPGSAAATEHVASHDRGADVCSALLDHRGAGVGLAALLAVHLPELLEREEPLVQLHPAYSERILLALVRTCNKAVQRHRDAESELAHINSSGGDVPARVLARA